MKRRNVTLYVLAVIALPVAAVLGLIVPLVLGYTNLTVLGLYFAVPMLAASILVGTSRSVLTSDRPVPFTIDWRVWSIPFHLTVGALVLLLAATDVRPYSFYAGVSVVYLLCFLMITTASNERSIRTITLYHLIAALLLVVFSVTLNYDFFVGRTDLTAHFSITASIVETGRTSLILPEYEVFQLWHIYTAVSYQLFGGWLALNTTMYLLSGGVFAAGVGLVSGVARRIYPDETYALLSCLIAILFPLFIFYGMYSIPRGIASILFVALLLTLASRPTVEMRLFTAFLIAAIVIYHPVTIPFILAILGLLYAVERTVQAPVRITGPYVFSSAILIMGIYWLYVSEFIVSRAFDTITAAFFDPGGAAVPAGIVASPWLEVANYVSFGFALFFLLVGFLFAIRRTNADLGWGSGPGARNSLLVSISVLSILLVPVVFPGPALLLDALAGVNVQRFGHYGFVFVALTGGYGLYELVKRGGVSVLLVLLLLVSLFAFTAVSNEFTASDNPAVERPFYTFHLTDQERQSFEAIDDRYRGEIGADRPTCRYMNALQGSLCSAISGEEGDAMFDEHEGVLIRDGEFEDRPLQFTVYVDESEFPRAELQERDRVYDSGDVSFHT